MNEKGKRRLAKGGVVVSQDFYDSLSDVQKEYGRFIVGDSSPLEELAGATLMANNAGFKGTCLTPFVYEYQKLRAAGQLEEA